MIRHMRHGSPPRLLAFQSILSPNRRESLPTPSAGGRIMQIAGKNGIGRRIRNRRAAQVGAEHDAAETGCVTNRPESARVFPARRGKPNSTDWVVRPRGLEP